MDRLWAKVSRGKADECWPWVGKACRGGYGQFMIGARLVLVHRFSWELANGPIPEGKIIRHTCDNPPCVNPAHLVVGTHLDNARDAIDRGRKAYGAMIKTCKLSREQVVEIVSSNESGKDIAARMGVSDAHISKIRSGKNRHRETGILWQLEHFVK